MPTIDHAIEGGDAPYALSLLAQYVDHFLEQGRMRLLARWFDAVVDSSDPLVRAHVNGQRPMLDRYEDGYELGQFVHT